MTEFAAPLPILARYAVMVDVGYIYAAAGELLFASSSRRDFRVDAVPLIQVVTKHADEIIRGELLRVYWYDAARDRVPTIDQRVIAQMPWVKLRLGNLNARGQQKGVDAQIRADMEALARHRAITDAVLIAGDEDMVPAVEAAQAFGVRVHLWGIEPPYGTNQAERLVWESDTVDVLDASFLRPYFTKNQIPDQSRSDTGSFAAIGAAPSVPSPAQLFGERHTRDSADPADVPHRRARHAAAGLVAVRDRPDAAPRARPDPGRGGRRARRAEVDPDPRPGQHPRPAARADPPAGDRQGAPGRRGEGARPVAAALPGGPRVAAGRVLGAGPPGVRHRHRQIARLSLSWRNFRRTDRGDRPRPVLRVIRGDATPEEIAAVVAALLSRAAASDAPPPARPAPSAWSDRSRLLRRPVHPGPDAWRRSALPG